jgi:hypothetical protein
MQLLMTLIKKHLLKGVFFVYIHTKHRKHYYQRIDNRTHLIFKTNSHVPYR